MGPRLLVVATAALAAEADYEERRRLAKVGVVYLEDDDSTNIQCVEEIYRYSRCLQDSACPATPRCQGAPTNAVDGDCTRWGKLDTLQPGRFERTRANCPEGCYYHANCQYDPEIWEAAYNWTDPDDRTAEFATPRDDDDADVTCAKVMSETTPWACTWDGLSLAPMRWGVNNAGVDDDDSPEGQSFNLQLKLNACGCQFWDALSCHLAHRCNGTFAEGQMVYLQDGSMWPWRDVEEGTKLLGGGRMPPHKGTPGARPTPCLDVCASSSGRARTASVLLSLAVGVLVMSVC